MNKSIDILCVGEALIDYIGHQTAPSLSETKDYHRYLGGSPTNVAMNMARLGVSTSLVASIGDDGFGNYVLDKLNTAGIDTSNIQSLNDIPTTVIFVSRTTDTPDFIPYRQADVMISKEQLPDSLLQESKIFHTTCFALSKEPARQTILEAAKRAHSCGVKLSIDINYSEKIWPERAEAIQCIKQYCSLNPLIKISEDDMERLFKKQLSHEEIFSFFHDLGVEVICLTLGSKGVKASHKKEGTITLPAIKIEKIMDATGAGDAFWSGFLFAYLKENSLEHCLKTALKLAALKLQNVGRLPENVDVLSELLSIE
ncbi:carbohydrate kinase family protein [Spongiivirga citrea]|uniref:Carbohydrate kinase n=1 Tax=Spongiivirga citrea TaxID=1481457 RepID=A0A6M0CJL9_9FLAO|nr:carbohydrate kinase [Spongiivirga citrea]NER18126.1 carbohydrate kinase [Spongiivirga citrea]